MIEVWRGNITTLHVDAIVNAANSSLPNGINNRCGAKQSLFEMRS